MERATTRITERRIRAYIEWYESEENPKRPNVNMKGFRVPMNKRELLYNACCSWRNYQKRVDIANNNCDWTMRSLYNYKSQCAIVQIENIIAKCDRKSND